MTWPESPYRCLRNRRTDMNDTEPDYRKNREWWFTVPPEVVCPRCGLRLGKRDPEAGTVEILLDAIKTHKKTHQEED